jgi:hypothetical protein
VPRIRTTSGESENLTIQRSALLCRTFSQLKISRDHHLRPGRSELTPLSPARHQLPRCHTTHPGSRQHHFRSRGIEATTTRRSPRKTPTFPTRPLTPALLPIYVPLAIARPDGLDTRAVTRFRFNMKPRTQSPTQTRTMHTHGHGIDHHRRLSRSSSMRGKIAACSNLNRLSNNLPHLHLE